VLQPIGIIPTEINRNMGLLGIDTIAATGSGFLLRMRNGWCMP
jgi:hypothetical protein